MKYILFFIILFITSPMVSQKTYRDVVKPRLSFVPYKKGATDISRYVIISNDTFYSKYKTDIDISFLNDTLNPAESFLNQYKAMVFMHSDENSKVIYEVKQWAAPIVVYLDKELPKIVREKFEDFYSQISVVNNLKITFTSKLEAANYYVKVTSAVVKGYKDDYKFYDEKDRLNSVFTGATYGLQTDTNNKFYSGILTVNPNSKNHIALLKQLKQVFFMSLGNFYVGSTYDSRSILSDDYDNASDIFDFDLNILKIHYAIIYDQKINATIFSKLYNLAKQN